MNSLIAVESKKSLSDSSMVEDDVDGMIDVESKILVSDSTEAEEGVNQIIILESEKPESDSLKEATIVIESNEPLLDLVEDGEGEPMIGVESKKPLSDSAEDEDNPIIGIESKEPSNLAKDDDDIDVHPMTVVDSSQSSVDEGDPNIGIDEPNPIISVELNKMSLDSEPSIHLAAQLEPCRSSQNTAAKIKAWLKVAAPPKLSSEKKESQLIKRIQIPSR